MLVCSGQVPEKRQGMWNAVNHSQWHERRPWMIKRFCTMILCPMCSRPWRWRSPYKEWQETVYPKLCALSITELLFFGCSKRLVFLGTQNAQEGEAEANSFKWHPSSSFDFVMSQNLSYQVLMIALYNLNTSWYRFQLPTGLSILETRFSTTSFGSAPSCFSQPNRIWHRLCWPLVLYSLVAIASAVKCRFNAGNETTAVELHNATNATTVSWLCKHENLLEFF